jgi:hypothetical protein
MAVVRAALVLFAIAGIQVKQKELTRKENKNIMPWVEKIQGRKKL